MWSERACTPASPESGANHVLIKENVECVTHEGEVDFGTQSTVAACAQRCRDHLTCRYFLYGNSGPSGRCWMENVETDDCGVDGFEEDAYNFYKLADTVPAASNTKPSRLRRQGDDEEEATCLSCLAPGAGCFFAEHGGAVGKLGEGSCKACKHLKGECIGQCPGALTSAACAEMIENANNGGGGTDVTEEAARSFPTTFIICDVEDRVGGAIGLSEGDCLDDDSWRYVRNPPITFATINAETTKVYNQNAIDLNSVWTTDAVVLGAALDGCKGAMHAIHAFIGQRNGNNDTNNSNVTYYQHDRRMELLENTLDSPSSVDADQKESGGGSGADRDAVCPVVPRTFLNEASCIRRLSNICGTKHFEPGTSYVALTKHTLETWHAADQKHVYVIRNLRLEKYYNDDEEQPSESWVPPCAPGVTTRWIRVAGTGGCVEPSPWGATTSATIASALSSNADGGAANAVVRDVMVQELEFVLLKEAVECEKASGEKYFGILQTLEGCAAACNHHAGCKYFLFGVNARVSETHFVLM